VERTKPSLLHFASSHCHFAILHPHSIHCSFALFHLVVSENMFSLLFLTFTGTSNQIHSTVIHVYSFCTISYFSFSSHWFYVACLLASLWFSAHSSCDDIANTLTILYPKFIV
jgi:hypothetical protein